VADLRVVVAGVVVHQARLVGLLAGVGAVRVELGTASTASSVWFVFAPCRASASGVGLGDGAAKVVSHCDHFVSCRVDM